MAVFIAPYVKHVIANPYDEPLEGVIVLFGDNRDFYHGFPADHLERLSSRS